MKILDYKEEILFIQFNTKYVWEYKPVTIKMYDYLIESENKNEQENRLIHMIRYNFLIGSIKEVNNDFSC